MVLQLNHMLTDQLKWKFFLQTNIIGHLDACKYGIQRYHQVSAVKSMVIFDRRICLYRNTISYIKSLFIFVQIYQYLLIITVSRSFIWSYHFPEEFDLMIANALNDKPLPVYGRLLIRDWLYVEDHCKAIDLIIHKELEKFIMQART